MSATVLKTQATEERADILGAPTVNVKRLPHGAGLDLPRYETALAAGADVRAAIDEPITLAPGERFMVPTGIAIALPPGWEAQMRPRSGLSAKYGIACVNAPGTIDAGLSRRAKSDLDQSRARRLYDQSRRSHWPDGDRPGLAGAFSGS